MSMPMDVVMAQTKMKQKLNSEYGKMVQKESTTRYYGLKLHKEKDADLIEYLDDSFNKQGKIKYALREQMKRDREDEKNMETELEKLLDNGDTYYSW